MKDHLLKSGIMTEAELTHLRATYQSEIDDAFESAKASDYAPAEKVFSDVYAEGGMVE